ncbi:hypothetical protein SESBI_07736 [Sesbania bispinosa]|nr:hypothetical protein SESBI_07736 [Sesbania bispinosa]
MAHSEPYTIQISDVVVRWITGGITTTLMVEQREMGVLTGRQQWRDTTKRAEGQSTFIRGFSTKIHHRLITTI